LRRNLYPGRGRAGGLSAAPEALAIVAAITAPIASIALAAADAVAATVRGGVVRRAGGLRGRIHADAGTMVDAVALRALTQVARVTAAQASPVIAAGAGLLRPDARGVGADRRLTGQTGGAARRPALRRRRRTAPAVTGLRIGLPIADAGPFAAAAVGAGPAIPASAFGCRRRARPVRRDAGSRGLHRDAAPVAAAVAMRTVMAIRARLRRRLHLADVEGLRTASAGLRE
jgi:hypothetical protein